jgi:hypothetical protein
VNRQLVNEDAMSSRLIFCWMESFEFADDRDDSPTVGANLSGIHPKYGKEG